MEQRLQKLIASAGIASRRHAEQLMVDGQVTVNGKVITELGARADPESDHIKVKGKLINPLLAQQKPVYVLLNKPRGYLTSMSDPEGRPLVIDLIPKSLGRLHSVIKITRTSIGKLEVEPLKAGQWRQLTPREVRQLKNVTEARGTPRRPRPSAARMRARRH